MSGGRIVLLGGAVLAAAAIAAVTVYLGPIAPVATGYAAKITCSGHHVSGRPVEAVQGDLPSNPLVPFLRTEVDEDRVRTTFLGAWGSTAWYTPGHGCILAQDRPELTPITSAAPTMPDAPWPAGDGPPVADPDGVDLDAVEGALDTAFSEADLADDPDRVRGTRAVVVVHRGQLVAERYADGFDAGTALLGWSMSKSIANAILGRIANEEDADLDRFLSQRDLRPAWGGDLRAEITLDHLLTMTDGLEFEEVYDPGTDATRMLFTPRDAGAYAADKPLVAPPGTSYAYSSGTTNILCDVAHDRTGRGPELAHDLVFAPLGMTSAVLEPDASGGLLCSSFAYATARDWARFGQWFLDDGVWEGERLLPEGWVDRSTSPVAVADGPEHGYGAQWWLNDRGDGTLRMPDVPGDAYWASGVEGQQVVIVPSQELVVVRLGLSTIGSLEWGLESLLRDLGAAVSRVSGAGRR